MEKVIVYVVLLTVDYEDCASVMGVYTDKKVAQKLCEDFYEAKLHCWFSYKYFNFHNCEIVEKELNKIS